MSNPVIKKRDNTNLFDKTALRFQECLRIGGATVRVLDAFHGQGKLWSGVAELYQGKVEVLGIEKERGKSPYTVLEGDNRKFLPAIDLSRFDLIDLDAYGSVTKQFLDVICNSTFNGCPIFVTEITTFKGAICREILTANNLLGFYKKNRTVIRSYYYELLFEMFRKNGVKKIKYFCRDKGPSRKLYGVIYF